MGCGRREKKRWLLRKRWGEARNGEPLWEGGFSRRGKHPIKRRCRKNKRECEILGLKGKQSILSRKGHEKFKISPEQGSERGSWQGSGEKLKDSQMECLCMCEGPEGQGGRNSKKKHWLGKWEYRKSDVEMGPMRDRKAQEMLDFWQYPHWLSLAQCTKDMATVKEASWNVGSLEGYFDKDDSSVKQEPSMCLKLILGY